MRAICLYSVAGEGEKSNGLFFKKAVFGLPSKLVTERMMKKWFFRIFWIFGAVYGGLTMLSCSIADRMIFQPPTPTYSASTEGLVRFGKEEEFAGLFFPAQFEDAPVLLWGHGNAEDAGHFSELALQFQARGISVFVYDYPGYGLSAGEPNEAGTYQAADEAYRFLLEDKKISPERIFLLGQSVGGGPSTYLAEKVDAKGLILISPFKSAFRVVTKVKVLPWDRFDNWKRMPKVEMPLLLIHGENDQLIPVAHGRALFDRHKGPKEFLKLEGTGHNDLWMRPELMEAILRFVEKTS